MHRKSLLALALAAGVAGFGGSALAADATGKWSGVVNLPTGQALPFVAHLKQDGSAITGKLDGIGGAPDVEIVDGKIVDDTITFFGVRQVANGSVRFGYTGHMTADAIDFDIVRTDGQGAPLKSHTTRAAN